MQYVEKKDGKYFYKITIPMIFFDREDSDWACDEICDFGTRNTPFYWTEETEWENVLSEITEYLRFYLENGAYRGKLKSLEGVAVGFTDGDLNILT